MDSCFAGMAPEVYRVRSEKNNTLIVVWLHARSSNDWRHLNTGGSRVTSLVNTVGFERGFFGILGPLTSVVTVTAKEE